MFEAYVNYWLELCFRRKRILLGVASIVFGAVFLASALWPPVYESTAEILVQDNRAELLVAPNLQNNSPKDATIIANPVSQEDLNSEVELLTSLHLIEAAINGVPLLQDYSGPGAVILSAVKALMSLPRRGYDALHDTPTLTDRDRWALKLKRGLDPRVIKRSNVIEIGYRAHDARWCQQFLSRLINQYLDYHAQISHDPEAQIFFQRQARQLKAQLYESEEKLRAFQLQTGIMSLPDQNQALIRQLSDLQLEYQKNSARHAGARQQASSLEALLKATPERIEKETKSVQNLALAQLKPQVLQLTAERAELLSRYQPKSMRIREIDAKLAEAQKIIEREDHLEIQERSTDLNPVWVTIDSDLVAARADAEALEAGQADLAAQIRQTQERVAQTVNNGVELGRLQRDVQNDTEAYLTYVRKTEEARVAQALNTSKILNVSVSQPPLVPLKPVFPILWLNVVAGFMLASGLGLGAAYWEEKHDPKLYSAAAIAEVSGLNTVAVLREQN